ncbi:DUF3137 domain-containing protein [Maribellus sp. YY47]|uniref:DUF3137 domain-containing protein n=1 Tax=Maribellus sp. YY47 TaxID=2929486 RepID=UPI0020011B94|nr:DUF3137 domain-containing protein [Maribellus sp. YY47]MCK3684286.1 DUF3137 domain-containing protein [Maribellus sp. YY47]
MMSSVNLKEIYRSKLSPALLSLESQRKDVVKRILLSVAILLLGIVAFVVGQQSEYGFIPGVLIVIGAFVSFGFAFSKYNSYKQAFKNKVVRKVIESIDPDWNYHPEACISENEYVESGLFQRHWDRYNGDDLISGVIDKTDFRLSELHTQYKTVSVDSKGRRSEHWHTIFKGLFAHADFNKEIRGETFVLPDIAERMFGKWGQKLQKFSPRGELVKLENIEFEKYFVVYSHDQNEARYILTPKIMEAIVHIRQQFDTEIYLSFVGTRVYVAMSFSQDLFEPRLFRSGVRYSDIEQMYYQFNTISVIVNEMNLNTRIWTKE